MLNQHFNCDFDRDVIVFDVTKNVVTFFRKFIYHYQNDVVTIKASK